MVIFILRSRENLLYVFLEHIVEVTITPQIISFTSRATKLGNFAAKCLL